MNNYYIVKEPSDYGAFDIIRLDQISSATFHPHPQFSPPPLLVIRVGTGEYHETMSLSGYDAIELMKALELKMPSLTSEQIRELNEKRSAKTKEQADRLLDMDSTPF